MSRRETLPPADFLDTAADVGAGAGEVGPPGFAPGARVGPYRVMRLLGRGGMGAVWVARDEELGRKVALKVLREDAAHLGELLVREARTTAHFNHPHIVQIYSTGVHPSGVWLALELVDGGSLRDRLLDTPLASMEGARLLRGVADALVHAHAAGVVHQDLKPENILLGRDGRARVADFGLAQRIEVAWTPAETETLASIGMGTLGQGGPCGTPPYMSPEQFRGDGPSAASDLWAFGVLLWETLRLDRPFDQPGDTLPAIATRVLQLQQAPEVLDVPPRLGALVQACLSPDARARPTARDVRDALDAYLRPERAVASGHPPFRGLHCFSEEHAGAFFGREEEVSLLVEQLRAQPVLSLIGPSGTGKSSLVLGGLVPRLRESGPVSLVQVRPGRHPFRALAGALAVRHQRPSGLPTGGRTAGRVGGDGPASAEALRADPYLLGKILRAQAEETGRTALLFVDQLEELLTTADPACHLPYLRSLILAADDPADPVRVVLTLRDDFLGRLALDADIRRVLSRVHVVHPPGPAGLQRILEAPVQARGFTWENPEMVSALVEEMDGVLAALPLLQVAGALLWERRDLDRRIIPEQALADIGGLRGALASHADKVLVGRSVAEEDTLRRVLLRLVSPRETRAVVPQAALESAVGPGSAEALEQLVAHRLVSIQRSDGNEAEVELVHEALISHWGRLRRWLDEGRVDHRLAADVEEAARVWAQHGRRDEGCLSGLRLQEVLGATEHRGLSLSPLGGHFLEASVALQELRQRQRRRVWSALAGLLVLLVVASIGAAWERSARVEVQEALIESERARVDAMTVERDAATAALLYVRSTLDQEEGRTSVASMRALAGLELARLGEDPQTADRLWESVLTSLDQSLPVRQLPIGSRADPVAYAAAQPGRDRVAVSRMRSGEWLVLDVETGETVDRAVRCPPTRRGGAWSADGQRFAHQCADSYGVEILDPHGTLLQKLTCNGRINDDPQARGLVSWRGAELYVGTKGGVCIYSGAPLREARFLPLEGPLVRLDVSDRWVAAGVGSAEAGAIATRVWDRRTGALHLELPNAPSFLRQLVLTDAYLVRRFQGPPERLEVWSLEGAPRPVLQETSPGFAWQGSAVLDARSQTLLAPWEGELRRWSTVDWERDEGFRAPLRGRAFPVISPDGRAIVEAGWSGRLRVLDGGTGVVLFDDVVATMRLRPVGFLDDHRLLTWSSAQGLLIWDLEDLPSGGIPIDAGGDGVRLAGERAWWLTPRGEVQTASRDGAAARAVGRHPSGSPGRFLAVTSDWALTLDDDTLWFWPVAAGGAAWRQAAPPDLLPDGTPAPDGRWVALRTASGRLLVLDQAGRRVLEQTIAQSGETIVDGKSYGRLDPAHTAVTWSPDGALLIAEHRQSGERYRCAVAGWRCQRMATSLRQRQPTFSPDGARLFDLAIDTADETHLVRTLDPTTGAVEASWRYDAGRTLVALAASDDQVLAVGRSGHLVSLPQTLGSAALTQLHSSDLSAIDLDAAGARAVVSTSGRGRAYWLWDVQARRILWKAARPADQGWSYRVTAGPVAPLHWAVIADRLLLPFTPPDYPDEAAVVAAALSRSNLRVCRDSLEVVALLPFPSDPSPWAPAGACGGRASAP